MKIVILNNNNARNNNDADATLELGEGEGQQEGSKSRQRNDGSWEQVQQRRHISWCSGRRNSSKAVAEGRRERQKEKRNSNHVDVVENPTWFTSRYHFQSSEICKSSLSSSGLLHEIQLRGQSFQFETFKANTIPWPFKVNDVWIRFDIQGWSDDVIVKNALTSWRDEKLIDPAGQIDFWLGSISALNKGSLNISAVGQKQII